MKPEIPKIIHQIWAGKYEPLPDYFRDLGDGWKKLHPDFSYRFWNENSMNHFISEHFPDLFEIYESYPFDIQRWDVIRYLILYKLGGVYIDFDYECLQSIAPLISGKYCCFAMEPEEHAEIFQKKMIFNNALMASVPNHPFMKKVIDTCFSKQYLQDCDLKDKFELVLQTTGPWMLADMFEKNPCKDDVYLIPAKYVSPFSKMDVQHVLAGEKNEILEEKLNEAYAIHYFIGGWLTE